MKKKYLWIALGLLAAAAATYWFVGRKGEPSGHGPQAGQQGGWKRGMDGRPMPVQAAAAKSGDIDVVINALGTVTARNTTVVKARVDGPIVGIAFREGQWVKEGDLLAEIDPRPFQVQLDQASGQLVRDQALLANAKLDLERYTGLLAKDSIAKQQVDAQQALVHQYEGTVQTDRAQVDNAKLQLGFTRITAPVAGRLGLRQVDVGNMVHASDASGIVVITQTQPVGVVFAIPAENLGAVLAHMRGNEALAVDALDRDATKKLASGKLITVDNQIDVATGTVKLKAEFPNADNALFPNQFVNARLRVETRHNATLIPTAAVQRGTQGTFVYVVGPEQTVSVRPVTLGPGLGDVVAVEKGLTPGEQVVTDGADKLREGAKVDVTTPGAPPPAGAKNGRGPDGARGPGGPGASPEERQKRWAETNARIDRGEFGEEMKKLPEEERKQRMREMWRNRGGGGSGGQNTQ